MNAVTTSEMPELCELSDDQVNQVAGGILPLLVAECAVAGVLGMAAGVAIGVAGLAIYHAVTDDK